MDLSDVVGKPVIEVILTQVKPGTLLNGKLCPIGKDGEEVEIDQIICCLKKMIDNLERMKESYD